MPFTPRDYKEFVMSKLKKVLILESDDGWSDRYNRELRTCSMAIATTLDEARECFRDDGPFDCIVVCGCLSEREPSTVPFVQMVRDQGFKGPIIAASNMPSNRNELLAAGCSHAVANTKADTSKLVLRAMRSLGLQAFTAHMAQRLGADISGFQAVREFEKLADLEFMPVVLLLRDSLERGDCLYEAMEKQSQNFDQAYLNAVREGELGGMLLEAFCTLAGL